uniref:glutathione S-transferase n=1 Tax=Pararhizobium sp. IMCC3301 TaxID=3067904 RepID=UPI00274130B2|nr:glutathione S-transferase N-terminal domain-containing protein [Pararhizobium sp. IMCC3301]
MMILRSSPPSPFGRQIKIAANLLGVMDQITVEAADTTDPHDSLRQQNPLGKIPILITTQGTALYDSRVILDYLDELAGGGKLVPSGEARFPAYTLQALANGIIEAALIQVYEKRFRPEQSQSENWLSYQAEKVMRGLQALETSPPTMETIDDIHIGHVALACALGYLDFRFAGKWRDTYPALVAWLDGFSAFVPSFSATRIDP